jgi:hypothetical protein
LAIDIPILDSLSKDPVENIKTGQFIVIENDEVSVAE